MCLFININGTALHWKNRPHVFKCLSKDHTKLERAFWSHAAMPSVVVLGLGITAGCPFKTVPPSMVISECWCRRRCHGKAMPHARHSASLHRYGRRFAGSRLVRSLSKERLSHLKTCLGFSHCSGRFKVKQQITELPQIYKEENPLKYVDPKN